MMTLKEFLYPRIQERIIDAMYEGMEDYLCETDSTLEGTAKRVSEKATEEIVRIVLLNFFKAVERRAEGTMSSPPYKLEGAHYNAMKAELALLEGDSNVRN